MRRVATILYQALTVPPPTAERVPPSFGWFRPLEQPDRERVGAARRVLPVATMVAQETPWPYNQPATDNANVRWHRPLSEPQRFPGGRPDARHFTMLVASGETPWPYIQPQTDNANARWHRPLSEPLRFKGGWPVGQYFTALAASGPINYPAIQPDIDNRTTRWFQPLSEPTRFRGVWTGGYRQAMLGGEFTSPIKEIIPVATTADMWFAEWRLQPRYVRDPRYSTAFAAGETPWPYVQPAADNATTRWHQPFSLPQRFPRDPRYGAALDASGEPKWPYNQPASDNASTRWFQPLSEPRREYRFVARITGETPWPVVAGNPTGVFPSNWYAEWRLPQRALRDPRYGAAFAAGEFPWPYNQPASDNANARWFQPLSEPRREYRWIARAVGETPWSRIQPNPISMAWWKALEEPRRFLRDPRYSAVLIASGEAPLGQPTASSPLGATRRALLRSGAFPTFWPGAS